MARRQIHLVNDDLVLFGVLVDEMLVNKLSGLEELYRGDSKEWQYMHQHPPQSQMQRFRGMKDTWGDACIRTRSFLPDERADACLRAQPHSMCHGL